MAHLTVQRLLEDAQGGQKQLNTEERRRVVAYLMSTQPNVENTDMARWFGVSEAAIRKDKKAIREQMAKDVKEDDIGLVVADLLWDIKRQIRELEESKDKTSLGSKERRMHIESIADLRLKTVKALQDLGFLPKNLGSMVMERFEYAAVVSVDGSVDARPIDLFDDNVRKQISQRAEQNNAQVLEAEYQDVPPMLPPAREVFYDENRTAGDSPQTDQGAVTDDESQAGDTTPAATTP